MRRNLLYIALTMTALLFAGCTTMPFTMSEQPVPVQVFENVAASPSHTEQSTSAHTSTSIVDAPVSRSIESNSQTTDRTDHGVVTAPPLSGEVPQNVVQSVTARLVEPGMASESTAAIGTLWRNYKVFKYAEIVDSAANMIRSTPLSGDDTAAVFILAGASAYALGNIPLTYSHLETAVLANPQMLPDPRYFPSAFCAIHASTVEKFHGKR